MKPQLLPPAARLILAASLSLIVWPAASQEALAPRALILRASEQARSEGAIAKQAIANEAIANQATPEKPVANEAAAADLPPLPQAQQAIQDYADVQTARQMQRARTASSAVLRAGAHEVSLRLEAAQRDDRVIGQRYHEWGAMLERPIRLPEKARLDDALGRQGIDQANIAVADALHESGRTLLRLWFAWMRASASETLWQTQLALLNQQLDLAVRRSRAGDAPRQDVGMAEAALAQAGFARLQAASRTANALVELQRSFPALPVPAGPVVLEPKAVGHDLDYWTRAVMSHNHELRLAQAEVRRLDLVAQRARAEQTPDPTVGLRYGSERNSGDLILGLFVSVPLGGEVRRTRTTEAESLTDVARSRETALTRRLGTELISLYGTARLAQEAALKADAAAKGMRRSAELAALGYSLGEGTLTEVLLANRLAVDAAMAATLARLDASESRYRLLLDAHELWDFD